MTKKELTGIAGFVSNPKSISQKGEGTLSLRLEAGSNKVVFKVQKKDISKVVIGKPSGKETFVQLLLLPGSHVETEIKILRDMKNLQDPSLARLTAVAISTVSSVSG